MGPSLFETSNQLWVFLFTIYGGVVLGLLYDLFRAVGRFLKGRHVLVAFLDILYWIVATALLFALLYYACEGEFRYYDVLGFCIGAALWFLGPGKGLRWMQRKINNGIHFLMSKFKETSLYKYLSK
jgi:spore cortex biosynthesis protein YabQ